MPKNKSKLKNRAKNNDPLITAIQEDNFELLQNIVNKAGLNFSPKWLEGYALLCTAIKCQKTQVALWLLSKNCRINREQDDTDEAPIYLAIYNNQNDVMKALIEKGACLNVRNNIGQTPLHVSCLKKDAAMTELLLSDETLADIPDSRLTTPLHLAVEIECLEIVELLLNHKVNVNAYTLKDGFEGFTPLHIAIYKRNTKIIQMLLDKDADLKASIKVPNLNEFRGENQTSFVNYQDFMPLHIASKIDDYDIIKLLLDHNADVDAVVKHNGMTALHIAVENKNKQNVILFSIYNADFCAETKEGKNVLHLAVENDWPELVEVLIKKGADINSRTFNGETPLYIAVEMGDENIVELLLKLKADVNLSNSNCKSPLHIAAEYSPNIVKLLLEAGANIDAEDSDNETALNIAVRHQNIDIIKEILMWHPSVSNSSNQKAFLLAVTNPNYYFVKVVDLMLRSDFKITKKVDNINLLRNSIAEGHIAVVKYLLEYGVDISKIQENNNLLHYAIKCQNISMVELLIKYNFNINAVDIHGQTPVGYAIESNHLTILELLLSHGANICNITSPLLNSAKENNMVLIQILSEHAADINVCDKFGTTVLHFAVWNKYYSFVEFLLNTTDICMGKISVNDDYNEEADDPYTKEFRRQVITSPLHIAVNKKSIDICTILLEHHANVNSKDGYGRTPLHIASAIKSTEQKNMIKLLINYGGNINTLDDFQKLPVYYIYNQTCVCSVAFQNQYEVYSECECDLYEDYSINDVIEFFVKHITLLASMNMFVHIDNLKMISTSEFSEKLQISCLNEIEKMKEEKIGDCLSFYDILVKKSNSLAACVCNEDVIKAFETTNYESKFPLYYELLTEQFNTAKTRQYWLQSATSALNNLLKFKLPEIIAEKVFQFLHLNDLLNLSNAGNNPSNNDDINPRKKIKVS